MKLSTHERVLTPTQTREELARQHSHTSLRSSGGGDADDVTMQSLHVAGDFSDAILRVSDLVDKYWNGSKSLLKNIRFKSQ